MRLDHLRPASTRSTAWCTSQYAIERDCVRRVEPWRRRSTIVISPPLRRTAATKYRTPLRTAVNSMRSKLVPWSGMCESTVTSRHGMAVPSVSRCHAASAVTEVWKRPRSLEANRPVARHVLQVAPMRTITIIALALASAGCPQPTAPDGGLSDAASDAAPPPPPVADAAPPPPATAPTAPAPAPSLSASAKSATPAKK